MMNAQGRIFRSVVVLATLGFGVGCGGTIDEMEPVQEQAFDTQEAAAEEPRKLDDLISALDTSQGILHTLDTAQDTALRQLEAVKINDKQYQAKDALTGEISIFTVQAYPIRLWFPLFKLCPNGQWVLSSMICPQLIAQDTLTRVWQNSTCNRKIQSANWSTCVNTSSGGSYRYQYYEAWKCGVGTGYCVERKAVKTLRYDYDLASCDPSIITGVNVSAQDFLCKH